MALDANTKGTASESPSVFQPSNSFETSTSSSYSQQYPSNSSNSQSSQTRPTSSEVLELSQGSLLHRAKTPSTSLSNNSSQEPADTAGVDSLRLHTSGQQLDLQEQISPSTVSPSDHRINASKRMADGEIKTPGYSLPTSPVNPYQHGHSRNSSRASRNSQIGELSSQLKTRLSYAMMKVQNGWHSQNISELESLTSNQGSPIFVTSEQRRPHTAPFTGDLSAHSRQIMQSSARESGTTAYGNNPAQPAIFDTAYRKFEDAHANNQTPSPQIGAAYESFWREHEGSNVPTTTKPHEPPVAGPSLAPPVDILPRDSRHTDVVTRRPPALRTSDLYHPKGQPLLKTPSPKKSSQMRTASQQAAVEKDAVETLLFMSSPINSGYYPPGLPSGTPLRSEVTPQATYDTRHGVSTVEGGRRDPYKFSAISGHYETMSRQQLSDAKIDKMLDEMPDTSSSDEDLPKYPRL